MTLFRRTPEAEIGQIWESHIGLPPIMITTIEDSGFIYVADASVAFDDCWGPDPAARERLYAQNLRSWRRITTQEKRRLKKR